MKFTEKLKRGSSTCFTGKFDRDAFRQYAAAGIDCVELSTNYNNYFNVTGFVDRPEDYATLPPTRALRSGRYICPFRASSTFPTRTRSCVR